MGLADQFSDEQIDEVKVRIISLKNFWMSKGEYEWVWMRMDEYEWVWMSMDDHDMYGWV